MKEVIYYRGRGAREDAPPCLTPLDHYLPPKDEFDSTPCFRNIKLDPRNISTS